MVNSRNGAENVLPINQNANKEYFCISENTRPIVVYLTLNGERVSNYSFVNNLELISQRIVGKLNERENLDNLENVNDFKKVLSYFEFIQIEKDANSNRSKKSKTNRFWELAPFVDLRISRQRIAKGVFVKSNITPDDYNGDYVERSTTRVNSSST